MRSLLYKNLIVTRFIWTPYLRAPGMALNLTSHLKPRETRKEFRTNSSLFGKPSASYSLGHLQANVAILPSSFADDFSEFCIRNKAPCPLIYRSQRGELDTPMSKGSDIRTDVSKYLVTKYDASGKYATSPAWELTDLPFEDMVTFYIGCSFTFDNALINAGIPLYHVVESKNVAMYNSNIRCHPVGVFSCDNMVVSMRSVKKSDIEKAVAITSRYHDVHGAPVHIGDPGIIGIEDLYHPDAGCRPNELSEDEVPVFWGCGVTSSIAIRNAKPGICISHSPGCMFVFDVNTEDFFNERPAPHGDEQPKVIPLQDNPYYASILGEHALDKINKLEAVIQEDPGNRGIEPLHKPGELIKAALRASHANSIAIATGFPVKQENGYVPETDGPLGALTMAKAFQALGKSVTLVGSHYTSDILRDIVKDSVNAEIIPKSIEVEEFTPNPIKSAQESACEFLYHNGDCTKPRFDVLIAIEALGRTKQGNYKSMMARDLTSICKKSPVDELFIQAQLKGNIATIGIGDGGNEIGMGNVKNQVQQYIKNGQEIACDVTTSYLITAGVSNWGGLALAMSVYILQNCLLHNRYRLHGIGEHCAGKQEDMVNSYLQEEKVLEFLMSRGVVDGVLGKAGMSVDGMEFNGTHKTIIEKMASILEK